VAVLHNLKRNAPPDGDRPADALAELDIESNIEAYCAALASRGHQVVPLDGNADLLNVLHRKHIDICFNTCEGYRGDSREAQVPALLEMDGIPYTGGKVMCLANTLDKSATKHILVSAGVPTPGFQEFLDPGNRLDPRLRFPLFLKPNREGTGIGIDAGSVVHNEAQLRERVAWLLQAYRQTVIAEEYVPGEDVTCGLVGNLSPRASGDPVPSLVRLPLGAGGGLDYDGVHVFPVSQINHAAIPNMDPYYSHAVKALPLDAYPYTCPAPLAPGLTAEIMRLTIETFRVTRSLDFGRVDFRLHRDQNLRPYVIEINALPGLAPISDLVLCARAEGWSYADLLNSVLEAGLRRNGLEAFLPKEPMRVGALSPMAA
jgi:D-alanine-D-alanine ligase